ncbi:MAG: DUF5317 family protein [Chloroflexota bacterium]|nr:DUF5317 family protein [Chloroflexota bacterium]
MFILYAVVAGLIVGWLLRGRLEGLAGVRLRWPWLAVVGLVVQLVLFSGPVTERVGEMGPPLYIASTFAVLVFVLRNLSVRGFVLVAAGAASNLVAILVNGGYMPVSPEALAAAGAAGTEGYSNSRALAHPALEPLTDVFALPSWVPFANVFSVGDVLIGVGVAVTIAAAMRQAGPAGDDRATVEERPRPEEHPRSRERPRPNGRRTPEEGRMLEERATTEERPRPEEGARLEHRARPEESATVEERPKLGERPNPEERRVADERGSQYPPTLLAGDGGAGGHIPD